MSSWDKLLQDNLLKLNSINGVILLTPHGQLVHEHGYLENLPKENWNQFTTVFKFSNPKHDEYVCSRGFSLNFSDGTAIRFKAYHKTHTSVYTISEGEDIGLLVCNLPYGILLCSYNSRIFPAGQIVRTVENFCDLLRA